MDYIDTHSLVLYWEEPARRLATYRCAEGGWGMAGMVEGDSRAR